MSSTAFSFLAFIIVYLCASACTLNENFKNWQFKRDFRIEDSFEKNVYYKADTLIFSRRSSSPKSSEDTFSFYLNRKFLYSRFNVADEGCTVLLRDSQFGENILEVRDRQNKKIQFRFFVFPDPPQLLQYKILQEYDHDVKAFTQGLIVRGDTMIESTGGYGTSVIKKYNYKTGKDYEKAELDQKYFGEGITNFNGTIYLLTYKEKEILLFKEGDLKFLKAIPFFSEGWGITHNNNHLILSDGSSSLYFIDPVSFQTIKVLTVFDDEGEVKRLNELEYVDGEIYANIWFKDEIVVIDPESGAVIKKIDLKQLVKNHGTGILSENVLNGIAYDEKNKNLFITGKRWPLLYKVKIVED